MKSKFLKLNSINPTCKYEFSNTLINHLGIKQKPYTINEMSEIIKNVMFKHQSKKNATWEDKDVFKIKSDTITYNKIQHYAMTHFIIRESNEPDCLYYYYYQIPVEVKKIDLN